MPTEVRQKFSSAPRCFFLESENIGRFDWCEWWDVEMLLDLRSDSPELCECVMLAGWLVEMAGKSSPPLLACVVVGSGALTGRLSVPGQHCHTQHRPLPTCDRLTSQTSTSHQHRAQQHSHINNMRRLIPGQALLAAFLLLLHVEGT